MIEELNFCKEHNNIIYLNNKNNELFGILIENIVLKDFELEFQIHKNYLVSVLSILKYSSFFLYNVFLDLIILDHPKKNYRFFLFYQLYSIFYSNKCRVLTQTEEYINSVMRIYPNACWAEREGWDMFGVFFFNNYDLRRILTDYGFEDFPLQKTFRLTGNYEVNYNENLKRIVYQNINETQKFREFTFLNPWGSFASTLTE